MLKYLQHKLFPSTVPVRDPRIDLGRQLQQAICSNDFAAVSRLLESGADVHYPTDGRTPLTTAVRMNSPNMVRALLAAGASPNEHNAKGWTVLHEAANCPCGEVVRILIDAGAAVNQNDATGHTPIFFSLPECFDVLREAGARIDVRDVEGRTPLHTLTWYSDNLSSIKKLIDAGLDINDTDYLGRTPLMLAFQASHDYGRNETVARLLQLGALADTAFEAAVRDADSLATVVAHMKQPLPDDILLRYLDSNRVKILLNAGANPNARDDDGTTPLMRHVVDNDTVRLLLNWRADVHASDDDARTALHHAAENEDTDPDTIRALLAAGADPAVRDHQGLAPIDLVADDETDDDLDGKPRAERIRRLLSGADDGAQWKS